MNVQGEEQKKLDVISNDVLKNALRTSGESRTFLDPLPFLIVFSRCLSWFRRPLRNGVSVSDKVLRPRQVQQLLLGARSVVW